LAARSRLTRPLFQRVRDSVFNETRSKQVKFVLRWWHCRWRQNGTVKSAEWFYLASVQRLVTC